ncbi:MAG TPA: hypothetical protein VHM92_06470 [Allosphingosinicella sp.]|nr:hypothetical protein [Allosphingosinicella sp.]
MDEEKGRKPRRWRFTAERRERFLEVLAQTGNRGLAADAIGVEPRLMDQRRGYDPLLDRQWREAGAAAERRLAGIEGAYSEAGGEVLVVWRGPNGRRQLRKPGAKRWSRAVEDRFFGALAMCGNIGASARAVGFSQSCIDQRRRKYPEFARRLEEALDDAEVEIEFRVAAEVRGQMGTRTSTCPPAGPEDGAKMGTRTSTCPLPDQPLDLDAAMRFLKWREEKRRGAGRRGRVPKAPDIDAVTERIVRQVQAIKRQRGRGGA